MMTARTYGDGCGIAHALDLVGGPVSAVSAMLTLRTSFHTDDDWSGTVQVRLGVRQYRVRITHGAIDVTAGEATTADAVVETDPDTFVAALSGRAQLPDGAVRGDRAVVDRLIAGTSGP